METKSKRKRLEAVKVTNSNRKADKMAVLIGGKMPAIDRHNVSFDNFALPVIVRNDAIMKRKLLKLVPLLVLNESKKSWLGKTNGFIGETELKNRKREIYGNDASDNSLKNASKITQKKVRQSAKPISEQVIAKLARSCNFVIRDKITGRVIGTNKGTGNKIW